MRSDEPGHDERSEIPADVPEADAVEQRTPAVADDESQEDRIDSIPDDVPEADALEQAIPVPPEDETTR
jgi:hypothetical protein